VLARTVSLALCLLTFALVVLGGVVHATGSSLACPDWPTCHGSLAPAMVGGVRFEHSHRLLAGAVVLATLGLSLSARGLPGSSRPRRIALVALGLVVVQALLGAATVLLRLPAAISIAHLAVAMSFFLVSIWLAWLLHAQHGGAASETRPHRRLVLFALICVGGQILLGALVRHTSSGLACLSFPGCDGSASALDARQWIHLAHRAGALMVAVSIGWLALRSVRGPATHEQLLVLVAVTLAGAQVVLGVLSVLSTLAVWAVTLHLALGTLLLAVLWLTWLWSSPPRRSDAAVG